MNQTNDTNILNLPLLFFYFICPRVNTKFSHNYHRKYFSPVFYQLLLLKLMTNQSHLSSSKTRKKCYIDLAAGYL